jgi:hypothetical protein
LAGGELDQIRFLLGHVSIQTTERYLGCKQRLRCAVSDRLGIEPDLPSRVLSLFRSYVSPRSWKNIGTGTGWRAAVE